jgi:hypothetical protein
MKIIIYATHSFGTYDTLKIHPDIVVLGFGTKWKGFIEKAKVIQEYLDTLPDNEVVVIIDGFDSYIKKTNGLLEEFESMDCKVLVSLHNKLFSKLPAMFNSYIEYKVFTYCKENYTVNSGLMIGYVEYLKIVWYHIANGPSDDDQRNINIACKNLPFLKIDDNNKILENCSNMNEVNKSNAYFCQIPGTITLHRITRAIFEYAEYFVPEIIAICIVFIYLFNRKFVHKLIKYSISYLNKKRLYIK